MPDSLPTNNISRYVYFMCVVLMCYASFFFYPRWKQPATEATLSWDVSGYYWYLPSVFIYKDLKHQSFRDSVLNKYQPTNTDYQQGTPVDNGNYVMKYSSGMAFMYLPFFTAAHLVAGALGYPRDGFSPPYQFAIQLGGLLVAFLGLWYLRKLLLLFYDDKVVAITLVLLVLGSNYINYAAIDTGMSHSWLFTVYVFLLLNTHYFYQTFKMKYAVRIGLLVGLATLTRPTDIISCLIPLLWGINSLSFSALQKQMSVFTRNYRAVLIAGFCAACVMSIQLFYWKYASGHWLVYSYPGQKLYFRSPNFINYTFSYRSGWLVYTPMMMLAFIGIIPFLKSGQNKVAIIIFFLLNYYLVCTWNIWWYGGRAMIQSYPVLVFCIAALVQAALNRKVLLFVLAPVALAFIYFNFWITVQQHNQGAGEGLYDSETMNEPYFWRVAGRWTVPARTIYLRDVTEIYEPVPKDPQLVYQNYFKQDTGSCYFTSPDSTRWIVLNKETQRSPVYSFPLAAKNKKWLRVQALFQVTDKEYEVWKIPQLIVSLSYKNNRVKQNMIRAPRLMAPGQTQFESLDMKLPESDYDSVHVFFWNAESDKTIRISDLKAWTFNE